MIARYVIAFLLILVFVAGSVMFGGFASNFKNKTTSSQTQDSVNKFSLDGAKSAPPKMMTAEEVEKFIADIPDPVAEVDGEVIPRKRYVSVVSRMAQSMQKHGGPNETNFRRIAKSILDNLIKNRAMFQEAVASGIIVAPAKIDEIIENQKKRFPDPSAYKKAMEQSGMTSDEQREYIKEALSINQLLDAKVLSKIKIPDESAKSYYDLHQSEFDRKESIRAGHILVLVKENAPADEKKKAEEKMAKIRKELADGVDFADVAKKFSEDSGSAKRGGELGFFSKGMMVKPFEEAAFALKDGETSDIVTSRFGMHIIKRYEHKNAGLAGFDEVKDKIKAKLKKTEVQKEMGKYIASIMEKRKVVKHVN